MICSTRTAKYICTRKLRAFSSAILILPTSLDSVDCMFFIEGNVNYLDDQVLIAWTAPAALLVSSPPPVKKLSESQL